MNRLVIVRETIRNAPACIVALYDEAGRPIELIPEHSGESSLLGNIYVARVENIVSNLNAAFVRISEKQRCYLPFEELLCPVYVKKQSKTKPLCIGDELFVQVTKEAVKTKEPVVSANLSLTGKYVVLTTGLRTKSVSRKLPPEAREHYRKLLKALTPEPAFGVVIRTNAQTAEDSVILDELQMLSQQLTRLTQTAKTAVFPKCVHAEPPSYLRYLRGLCEEELTEILTDDPEIFREIVNSYPVPADALAPVGKRRAAVDTVTTANGLCIRHYTDPQLPLSSLYPVRRHLEEALQKKVWLKSGGYLVIEPTEAMTVIDVNTGKSLAKKNMRENILRVNREAAVELARQLRLRSLSGIILADFINMEDQEDEKELLALLRAQLKKDPVPTQLIDLTQLGFAEITRKKVRRSLYELLQF